MALAQLLVEQNFPAIAIHRAMAQEERLSRYQQFKDFQKVSKFIIKSTERESISNLFVLYAKEDFEI